MSERVDEVGCWVLPHDALVELLRQARNGEDPDTLLVELYANSDDGEEGGEGCGWADPAVVGLWMPIVGVSAAVAAFVSWATRRRP